GRDPYHYFPGIPTSDDDTINWFTAHGYEKQVTEFDFYRHFHKDEPIVQPEFSDVTFELLQYEDRENFIQFLNRCFPGRWEYEAIKYFELGGRGREFVVLKKRG